VNRERNEAAGCGCEGEAIEASQRKVLVWVLAINAAMFLVEFTAGWLAESTGLIADSLDMLADALVYGVGLYAVGKTIRHKARAAMLSGTLEFFLAITVLADVVRRYIVGSDPDGLWMMGIAAVALLANVASLMLLAAHRQGEIHMRAMWICTNNDVLVNIAVIASGGLVLWLGSPLPDLVVGVLVSLLVLHNSIRIMREARRVTFNAKGGSSID